MLRIACVFENNIDKEEWHKDLLLRMKLNIGDIRPAVTSPELTSALDEYRRFRHLFRHAYSIELNREKVRILIAKLEKTKTQFVEDINNFVKFIDILIKEVSDQ